MLVKVMPVLLIAGLFPVEGSASRRTAAARSRVPSIRFPLAEDAHFDARLDSGTVPRLLLPHECQALIGLGEQIGFEYAGLQASDGEVIAPDYRNNSRATLTSSRLARALWARSRAFLPESIVVGSRAVGLSKRLRFYRYESGQSFNWHTDGAEGGRKGQRSFLTYLIYLNHDFEGGGTSFSDGINNPRFADFTVTPETGLLLWFRHPLLHRGDSVTAGRKYVLRSDVMYQ